MGEEADLKIRGQIGGYLQPAMRNPVQLAKDGPLRRILPGLTGVNCRHIKRLN